MDERFSNRFNSCKLSLQALSEARTVDIQDHFIMSGVIQKFSLTFDVSWKVMKDLLVGYYGIADFATGSPRETLKKAMSCGIISSDLWIDMMNDRNLLAHDYDGTIALEKVRTIIDNYLPVMEEFVIKVEGMDWK